MTSSGTVTRVVRPAGLRNFTGNGIRNWKHWLELWKASTLLPIQEGLIHSVFSTGELTVEEADERIIFLLEISDEEAITYSTSCRERMNWLELRGKIRSILVKRWKHFGPPPDTHVVIGELLRNPKVLETLVWYFRPDEAGTPRNLPSPKVYGSRRDASKEPWLHTEILWGNFAIGLALHTWYEVSWKDCRPLRWAGVEMTESEAEALKQRLEAARPHLIPILAHFRSTSKLLEPKYPLDPASRQALEDYALGRSEGVQTFDSMVAAAHLAEPGMRETARTLILLDDINEERERSAEPQA